MIYIYEKRVDWRKTQVACKHPVLLLKLCKPDRACCTSTGHFEITRLCTPLLKLLNPFLVKWLGSWMVMACHGWLMLVTSLLITVDHGNWLDHQTIWTLSPATKPIEDNVIAFGAGTCLALWPSLTTNPTCGHCCIHCGVCWLKASSTLPVTPQNCNRCN